MKRLYTPFKVNKLELKNRVIMSPMSIGHTVDGFIMDDVVEFYKRRAQGGVGLIIFANMQWDKLRYNPNHGAMLTDEKYIPSLKKLTDAIHEGGSKVFAQLMHRGRCANRASIQGEQAVAPSPIPGRFTHFEMPKELTVEEIKEFVDWQAEAAVIAKKAGFDGIEIETNSGYLYGQFFSPLTNHRTDEYGGSLENRCRFMVETLEGMRAAVGPDYPISLRVSGSDFMDGGCNGDDIAEICELLDKTGYVDGFSITAGWHESAVPLIATHEEYQKYDISSLKVITCGSAPLPVDVIRRVEELTGAVITEGYGMTETVNTITINGHDHRKVGTVGVVNPNIEYLIVDQETGTEVVEDGQPGEIICRGECVMHEYWNNPEETAKMLRNGWLYTGDIGRIDEEGFLIICDRKKDLIITGGFNVFPSELEAVAITAENVADAIAIGVPNERRGEVPAIFVQPIAGKTVDLNEVERVCREKLSRFKVPKEYYIMDMLPKTKKSQARQKNGQEAVS